MSDCKAVVGAPPSHVVRPSKGSARPTTGGRSDELSRPGDGKSYIKIGNFSELCKKARRMYWHWIWALLMVLWVARCDPQPRVRHDRGDAPFRRTPAAAPAPVSVSLVFGGDVMQHMPQVHAAMRDSTYDYSLTFSYLRPIFDSADAAIVNLETTLGAPPFSGFPRFASPVELAAGLRGSGVDGVVMANNHALDKGERGVRATLEALRKAGMHRTGVFADSADWRRTHPLVLELHGKRIALFNYTYGLNGLPVTGSVVANCIDTTRIAGDLRASSADLRIVVLHWGEEYVRRPTAEQRRLAAWCRAHGADVVIGGHPHVVQPIEIERDRIARTSFVTAYSLGNLVSNQRERYRNGGLLVRLEATWCDTLPVALEVSWLPVWVHTPRMEGRLRYLVLPAAVADTMAMDDPARAAYERFVSDTRALLADSPAREMQ